MARRMIEGMFSDRGFRSRWGVVATLIGYVALVGYAVFAQPEYRSPIAQRGHAVQANADRKSDSNQAPPYPITTLKALRAAEDAGAADCGTSEECRAQQRDYSDLQAQWEAAKGAEGQLRFARWQTLIAGLGTVLVAIALIYTAKATTAAIEANRISREVYIAEHRPWIKVAITTAQPDFDVRSSADDIHVTFKMTLHNIGKSPAHIVFEGMTAFHLIDAEDWKLFAVRQKDFREFSVQPDSWSSAAAMIFPDDFASILYTMPFSRAKLIEYDSRNLGRPPEEIVRSDIGVIGAVAYKFGDEIGRTEFGGIVRNFTADSRSDTLTYQALGIYSYAY